MLNFRITGLRPERFAHLFGLDDRALAAHNARRYIVDRSPGFADRIEMRDLAPGERAILVNYLHLDADTPYRASHAVYIREGATQAYERANEIPEVLRIRPLSLRAYDREHMMIDGDLIDGTDVERLIERFFSNAAVAYIHAHYAKRGCFAARIDR